jgi:hypothetical protein
MSIILKVKLPNETSHKWAELGTIMGSGLDGLLPK